MYPKSWVCWRKCSQSDEQRTWPIHPKHSPIYSPLYCTHDPPFVHVHTPFHFWVKISLFYVHQSPLMHLDRFASASAPSFFTSILRFYTLMNHRMHPRNKNIHTTPHDVIWNVFCLVSGSLLLLPPSLPDTHFLRNSVSASRQEAAMYSVILFDSVVSLTSLDVCGLIVWLFVYSWVIDLQSNQLFSKISNLHTGILDSSVRVCSGVEE